MALAPELRALGRGPSRHAGGAGRLDLGHAQSARVALRPDDPHRAAGEPADPIRHRAKDEALYAAPPMGAYDHQIRVEIRGELSDLRRGRAAPDVSDHA